MSKICILIKDGCVMDIYSDDEEINCTIVDYDENIVSEDVFVIQNKDMPNLMKKIQKELEDFLD